MIVTVVVGPPCAGKSRWVDDNAPAGAARLDFDRFAMAMGSDDEHTAPPVVFQAALAARRGVVGWVLDDTADHPDGQLYLIYSFITDDTVDKLAAAGAKFHLIDPGVDECLARAEKDGRPERTIDAIYRWYSAPPQLPGWGGEKSKKGQIMTKVMRATVGTVETRAAGDGPPTAEFEAYASVFDNVDSYGDIMSKGAFSRSLKDWAERGAPVPVLWGHNMSDPDYNIGHVIDAVEDERGLKVRASIDLESPKGATVYRLLKEKRVREMSFAFLVKSARDGERDGKAVRHVDDVDLIEVSVVPMGANPETEILAVRSLSGVDGGGHLASLDALIDARIAAAAAKAAADGLGSTVDVDVAKPVTLDELKALADELGVEVVDKSPAPTPDPAAKSSAPDPLIADVITTIFRRPPADS